MKSKIVLLMVMSVSLLACSVRKSPQAQPPPLIEKDSVFVNKTLTITVKDTVLVSKPDSLYYNAYIECVNNKPVLKTPEQKNTKDIKADVKLQDGKLTIDVKTEAQNLFLKWKETFEKENSGQVKIKPVPYPVIKEVPAELSKKQEFYMHVGKVIIWGALGVILFYILTNIPWKKLL